MIRPDHPAVRAMAEEMAREMHDSYATIHRGYAAWDDLPDYEATLTADGPLAAYRDLPEHGGW